MKQTNEPMNDRVDKEILFSKTVKAGKRVYYVDVKRDRRDAYYLAVTESKRLKENAPDGQPAFEKHKIFLYREDMERFMEALGEAVDYAVKHAPEPERSYRDDCQGNVATDDQSAGDGSIKFDIEF